MIDDPAVMLTFPDYEAGLKGRAIIIDGKKITEVSADKISEQTQTLICVDFGQFAHDIVILGHNLPKSVIDLEDLLLVSSQNHNIAQLRKNLGVSTFLKKFRHDDAMIKRFTSLNFVNCLSDTELLISISRTLKRAYRVLRRWSKRRGEWERYSSIEAPLSIVLYEHIGKGIRFNSNYLAEAREEIDNDFYLALKQMSTKHSLPLRLPNIEEVHSLLTKHGFDLEAHSAEYYLDFLSMPSGLGEDIQNLRRLDNGRSVLNGISHKKNLCFPEVYVFGTRTSRILLKGPSIQNLPKKYRSLVVPAPGMRLSYIDYDQFEVGIMAALSGDQVLKDRYQQSDLYVAMSMDLFGTHDKRKEAKRLFLSYAYGMKRSALINASIELGSTKPLAEKTFMQFPQFETWKEVVERDLKTYRRVDTYCGNHFRLTHRRSPTDKEKRSAVSQKVQGTGSLIFKQTALQVANLKKFRIVLPMHDALLVEHLPVDDPKIVVSIFEQTMTNVLKSLVTGKASLESF